MAAPQGGFNIANPNPSALIERPNLSNLYSQSVPIVPADSMNAYLHGRAAINVDGYVLPIGEYFEDDGGGGVRRQLNLNCQFSQFIPDLGGVRCETVRRPPPGYNGNFWLSGPVGYN